MKCEASPALAMGATILELRAKLLNAHKILIAVFVLKQVSATKTSTVGHLRYLSILAWNLDFIKLSILKLRQVMAKKVERLDARS
jgi:hypothetical protein